MSSFKTLAVNSVHRVVDVTVSAVGLTIAAPILGIAVAGTLLSMGRPILFSQRRPGLYGKPFKMWKLRTMNVLPDEQQAGVPDAVRITRWGRLLRETSIDELPELWNVFLGDMSLVGPRPLLMRYYPYFTPRERKRFEVRPGISGWAQVNGRSNVPWDERLEMDVWYVENRSLALDLRIILRTMLRVLERKDVHAEMREDFKYDLDVERSMRRGRVS